MADYHTLLEETIAFHQDLIHYANLLQNEQDREAASRLRTDLSVRFGRLGRELTRLGLPRHYTQFGRVFPLYETALRPASGWPGPDFDAIGIAIQGLEQTIGTIQAKAAEQTPGVSVGIAGFVVGAVAVALLVVGAWFVGRNQDGIWNALVDIPKRVGNAGLLSGNTPSLVALGVISTVFGGLLGNLIHETGWRDTWRFRRIKAMVYFFVLAGAGAGLIVLAKP